ncbi:MAG: helix-turn-helix domain-containing protein [Lautropia sp.]|nr:helix-turn-helix domain-containing protein [Lautropia sp.]
MAESGLSDHLQWHCRIERDEHTIIYPDGCRDILLLTRSDGSRWLKLADWDFRPRVAFLPAGLSITGFRMRPGTVLGEQDLPLMSTDPALIGQFIRSEARRNPVLDDVIEALVERPCSAEALAREQGVCLRTLQRRFRELGLPSLEYWRLLGRARRAAMMLPTGCPLIELASNAGYSDQAHMTREFVRWFGLTPGTLLRSPEALQWLQQPGLCNWV